MKLEEGMYVRTYNGTIFKIVGGNEDKWYIDISYNYLSGLEREDYTSYAYNKNNSFFKILAKKASHSPIDLIEVEDYVNGLKINSITEVDENHDVRLVWNLSTYGDDDISFSNEEIKSIVTKEQFESMKYEVKKDE